MKRTEPVGARARTSRAKTERPHLPASTLSRIRLHRRLDRLLEPETALDLMLLSAPAGFGKTTLLTTWTSSAEVSARPLAWCTLDDTDVSCFRFWSSLLAAVAASSDDVADHVSRLSAPLAAGDGDFLADLIDALAGTGLVLVLENLQEVTDAGALRDLNHLLGHLPAGTVAIISSRSDPPLPALQAARLAGRFDELRAADLAFRREEVLDVCGDLSADRLGTVWDWTEGWPALVRLMDLTLRSPQHPEFSLATRDGHLADYLFQETFRRQDEVVRRTLLLASVPDAVTVDLAITVTGHPGAGGVLEAVAAQSGLITRLDHSGSEETWYRLHPMLRAYLHGELRRLDPEAAREAHRVCARWLLEAGLDLAAVKHAAAAGDEGFQDEVVRVAGPGLVNAGESLLLLAGLGDARPRRRVDPPWTSWVRCAALLDAGHVSEAVARVQQLEAVASSGNEAGPLNTLSRAVHVQLARRQGLAPDPVELMSRVPAEDPDLRLLLAAQRGPALAWEGELDAARTELELAIDLARGLGRTAALIECLGHLAAVHAFRSELGAMLPVIDEALHLAERNGWANTSRMSHPHLLRAWAAHQALDDGLAAWHAGRAAALLEPTADPTVRFGVRALGAVLSLRRPSDRAHAADELHGLWPEFRERQVAPAVVAGTAVRDARTSLQLRHEQRIPETVSAVGARLGPCGEQSVLIALHKQAAGHRREARHELSSVTEGDCPVVVPLSEVEALTLAAILAEQDNDTFAATETARRALHLAEELAALRPLVDGGAAFHDLLRRGQGRWGAQERLVSRVLERASGPAMPSVALTSRELEVLRELPNLNTVEEIAGALFVSVNTVKTHMRSVYRKLGVTSRRAAVAEARRLGLF